MVSATDVLVVSDLAAAEFASAVSRRVRTGAFTTENARLSLNGLDAWLARATHRTAIMATDVALADAYLRRLDLALLTPNAIHIAIVQRLGAVLATCDRQMAAAARELGIAVAEA